MRTYSREGAQIVGTITREQYERQQHDIPEVHFVGHESHGWTEDY